MNEQRPSFNQAKSRGPDGMNEQFKKSETVRSLLHLLRFCFEFLIEADRIELGLLALLEAECSKTNFKWMWSDLLCHYTGVISKKILIVGVRQFEKQMNGVLETQAEQINMDFKQRLDILVDIISFLISKQHREMREIVQELFKKGITTDIVNEKCEEYSFVFLFKLASYPDLTRFLIDSLKDFASPTNVILGIQQLNLIWKRAMLDHVEVQAFIRQMVTCIDFSKHSALFSTIMELSFDPLVFTDFKKLDSTLIRSIKEGSLKTLDEILSRLLPLVHGSNNFESSLFLDYANGQRLQTCIEASLANQAWSPILIRYLHILTTAFGEKKGVEIVCRYIFTIREPQHFHPLCAFLTAITPFFPNLMLSTYEVLVDRRWEMEKERRERGDINFTSSFFWLVNLHVLMEFERNAQESDGTKYLGLHPGIHTGNLLTGILSWAIAQMEEALEKGDVRRVYDATMYVERILTVLAPFDGKASLPKPAGKLRTVLLRSCDAYKLSMQLAKMLQISLFALNYEPVIKNGYDILSVNSSLRETISKFFHTQMSHLCSYYFTWFLISFVENCLQNAREMFGETTEFSSGLPTSLNSYSAIEMEDEEISLFDHVSVLAERKKANQLAHSGIIGKGARKPKPLQNEHEHIRRHVFIDTVYMLIRSAPREKQLKTARSMALLLVDRLCGDSVAGNYGFADFEIEKEMISRYVKVSQRLATSLGEGLLTVVCDFTSCLHFAVPLMKAAILETMNLLDASFERLERKPTDQILVKIDRWLRIGIKGGLLPSCLLTLAEIIPICSAHEAFLILNEVYSYLKVSTHFQVEAERRFARAMRGETIQKPEWMRTTSLLELLVAILQRDISEKGKYLPTILKSFSKVEIDVPEFEVIEEIQEPDPES